MLYNTQWDSKLDPMSLDSLISWLEMQPKKRAYDYGSCSGCLLAKYFTAMGYKGVAMGERCMCYDPNADNGFWGTSVVLPAGFDGIARGAGYLDEPGHTYGKALERAKALQNA